MESTEDLSPRDRTRSELEATLRSLITARETVDTLARDEFKAREGRGYEKRDQFMGKVMAARVAIDSAIVAVREAFAGNGVRPA